MRRVGVAVVLVLLGACSGDGSSASSPLPIGALENHVLASTDDGVVVWGGSAIAEDGTRSLSDAGHIFDPGSNSFSEMSPAPIAARSQAFSFWNGTELFVLGGFGVTDAAAWHADNDQWRPLASEVPVASQGWDTAGAWDGERFVLWHIPTDRVWAYVPDADRWDDLGATGIPDRNLGRLLVTDHGVVAFSNQPPFSAPQLNGARLRDGSATWDAMPPVIFVNENGLGDPSPLAAAWSGGQLVVWAASGSDSPSVLWEEDLGQWRQFAAPALPACEFALRPAVTADAVVARNDCGDAALLDLATLSWSALTEFPSLLDVVTIEHDGAAYGLDPTGTLWSWTPPS